MSGTEIFLALGVAVVAVALLVGYLMRRTLQRQMPGSRRDTQRGVWFGASDEPDDSH